MKIRDILEITNGKLLCGDENIEVDSFVRDTRQIKTGDVFVAIKGESFNGNEFYNEAIENGAKACIVSEEPKEKLGNTILVEDTVLAIQKLATYKRDLYDIPVVAVTGSVGKTSTKDIIASVMSKKYKVLKTPGNLNNYIGLPFTILSLKDEEAMVIEMGMNHFGEISLLTQIAQPTVAVITNIGTAHIGNLGSRENILKAKLEILEGLKGNTVVINNDNDLLSSWAKKVGFSTSKKENQCNMATSETDNIANSEVNNTANQYNPDTSEVNNTANKYNIITYGIDNKDSKYVPKDIKLYEDKSTFYIGDELITVPVAGEHFILNALCAIAVGRYYDISMKDIKQGILDLELSKNRMEIINLKSGVMLINDTYNANYDSMKAGIEYLQNIQDRRKIAVLGDMLELGEYSEQLHRKIGDIISNVDILITVGTLAKFINQNAKVSNKFHCNSNEEAYLKLKEILTPQDAILVKASNSMKFGDIVERLKNE